MKRLLAALLFVASPVLAQAQNGWVEIANGWGEIQTPPGYSTIPAPSGCATTELAYFLGSPATLACLDQVYWTAATRSLDVTDGRVQAANLKAIGLATPGSITVTPTLTQVGSITTVAGSALVDGDYFTIKYDGGTVPIQFDLSPGDGATGGMIPLLFTAGDSADTIRDNIILTLNAAAPTKLTASSGGAATVSIVLDTPGADASATPNTENVADAGFAVTGFSWPTAATTVTYRLYACLSDGSCTEAGAASSTAASTATLSASNFLRLTWTDVSGAAAYKVGRYVSPTSPATTGIIWTGTALTVDDTGLAGDASAVGTVDGTGRVTADGLTIATGAGAGKALLSDASGNASWGAAGITNAAGANVVPKSDGTNLVASLITDDGTTVGIGTGTVRLGSAASATPVAQTLQAQGGSGTNIPGANLTIQPGAGTGNATPSQIILATPTATGSGIGAQTQAIRLTLDQYLATWSVSNRPTAADTLDTGTSALAWRTAYLSRATLGSKSKTLTDASATAFATIPLATGAATGGKLIYRVVATDGGTARQVVSGSINYAAVRDGATYAVDYDEIQQSTAVTTGTLTGAVTAAGASDLLTFSANFDTDLGTPALTIYYRFDSTDTLSITPL